MSKQKLVLVDGSSYLYRAFHALPPLTTARGEPTGALHGVLSMLNKLLREQETAHVAVIFDAPGRTFRDKLFEEYKANRPPMPDDLRAQIEPLLEAVPHLGLPLLRVDGVEADDVIGTLSQAATDAGMKVLVSTGDKDMAQLVNEDITLVNTMTDTVLDRDGVRKKFDVWPEQIVDYLALVGDKSDNIPGVPRVGPKTAAKWLNQYGSVANLVEHADEIRGKVGDSLRDNLEQLELSRKLATIRQDIDLERQPDALLRGTADTGALRDFYQRYELRSLLRQLGDEVNSPGEPEKPLRALPETDYETVLTEQAFEQWLAKIRSAPVVALDTETTSLDYMAAKLVGISLSVAAGEAAYIPVAHDYPGAPAQLSRDRVLQAMQPWLEDAQAVKLGHHLKYDAHIFARYGIELRGMHFDTMLESYVLNSVATRHDMDSVAGYYLGIDTIHYEDVAGKGAKQLTFDRVALEQAAPYAAEDADITLRLHQALWPELEKVKPLCVLYRTIEQPLVPVLFAMEEAGVLLDRGMLRKQSGELAKTMQRLEKKAHDTAGGPFNLGSPKQLQQILFEELGLPVLRKTPKGQPSTAEDVLQDLADEYDLPRIILDYRGVAKLKSTYTDKLPQQICEQTGRVHTSYHQSVAATGRLSSTDPNLQNIPIRSDEGRRIRKAFIAPEGKLLLAADYSQIELRIMAHLSGDKGLVEAFNEERDVHQATAAEVFGVAIADVTGEQRRSAKAINFGLMYGMSAFGLAKQLGTTRAEAQDYVDLYFERYPGVRRFMEDIREQAREAGFVETMFGRRLYLPQIHERNAQRRQYAERSAINAPMQGSAADIIKRAMIDVFGWLETSRAPARMIMQVHDELVFEVDQQSAGELRREIVERMCNAAKLKVPLLVEAGTGSNWEQAH